MRFILALISSGFLFYAASCRKVSTPTYPCSVGKIIEKIMSEPVSNPPRKIYQYTYDEQEVYYVTAYCCDIYSELYDCEGNIICHPDGGLTGKGDGKCTDFFEKRTGEKLIWEDGRQ